MFKKLCEWFKKILNTIWEWLVNFFNSSKKPTVKITVLTTIFILLNINIIFAQRTHLQSIWAYLYQPHLDTTNSWIIKSNAFIDSLEIYKNDTLLVEIKNINGEWVNWYYFTNEDIQDTVMVRFELTVPIAYRTEFTFHLYVRDTSNIISDSSKVSVIYFMASDINSHEIDIDVIEVGDNSIDGLDLIELSKYWGRSGVEYYELFDITGDGSVDGLDLIQLSKDWGSTWTP